MSSDTVYEFGLPDLGEGLTEAEVVNWLVEPGETVVADQPIVEVETDKALVDIPSPVDGTVREHHPAEGEFVAVGETLVAFDVDNEEPADEPVAESADSAPPAAEEPEHTSTGLAIDLPEGPAAQGDGDDTPSPDSGTRMTAEEARSARQAVDANAVEPSHPAEAETAARSRTLATPATRQLAKEKGIDIDEIPTDNTRDGEPFVTAEQVEAYADAQTAPQATDSGTADPGSAPEHPSAAVDAAADRIPYQGIRRTIGEQMERAKYTAPHVSHHDEADVTELVAVREELRSPAESRGVNLTYMPFVIKAVVAGLEQHPVLNARLDEDNEEIILHEEYNIGFAVATDAGLMVPVITDADEKGLLDLAREIDDLATQARGRSIDRERMQGSTFTITNFGRIGGAYSTPIINYPEVAILGLGEITERARVVDGEVVPRTTLPLSMSIDHRVVDGAEVAAFVNTVSEYLETPELLLLEQ